MRKIGLLISAVVAALVLTMTAGPVSHQGALAAARPGAHSSPHDHSRLQGHA
jgi:hypothetical protein